MWSLLEVFKSSMCGRCKGKGSAGRFYPQDRFGSSPDRNWQGRVPQSSSGKGKGHAIPPVPYSQAFVNRQTKPYPDKDSNILFKTNRSRGDAQTLSLEHIAQGLSHLNCEWHNGRLAHAMSFLCQNLTELCKMMQMVPPEEHCDQHFFFYLIKKTGFPALSSYFRSDAGEKLVLAADYLNFNAEHARDADGLTEALICVFSETAVIATGCS